jgi:signal transduction histidine kinase
MKLVGKLTLALVLGMSLVLAIFGLRSLRRERALLDAYRHRGDHLILHALSAATAEVWRRDGRDVALRMIDDADEQDDGLRLRWVWLDAPLGDPRRPAAITDVDRHGGEMVRVESGAGGPRAFVYARVDVGEGRPGAIELSESLEEEDQIVHAGVESAALAVVALAALGGAMALGLGAFFVGRPVRRIVEKTRRIGEGDLGEPLILHQRDELAQVAREINLMCERLGEARESLGRETSARIAALEQLRHADRLGTVGKLASGIAHELGTPLNVVGGRAKRILRAASPEEASDNARIIVEQADRMTRIIRQLLDFARRRGAQKAPADVAAIARGVLALLQPIAEKQRVTLTLAPREGDADARADVDAGQIQQALTNLVMNGIQAMPSGGALTVTVARARVTPPPARGGPEAEYLTVRVRDRGEGIRPEDLPHVFEPFFTTKSVGEGTGLGLSVTHGLVEEHGGWIDAASEPGQGATFTVYLPAR